MTDTATSGRSLSEALQLMKGVGWGAIYSGQTGALAFARASWLAGKAAGYSHYILWDTTAGTVTEYIPTQSIVRAYRPTADDMFGVCDWQTNTTA